MQVYYIVYYPLESQSTRMSVPVSLDQIWCECLCVCNFSTATQKFHFYCSMNVQYIVATSVTTEKKTFHQQNMLPFDAQIKNACENEANKKVEIS